MIPLRYRGVLGRRARQPIDFFINLPERLFGLASPDVSCQREVCDMANVGDRCRVGTSVPDSGQYKHSVCTNTANFTKGTKLTPCQNTACPNKGAEWILQQKLT